MHVLTSSLYRINTYRLFDLISHKLLFFNIAHRIHLEFEKNNRKSSWVVLIVIGTNTIYRWSFFFFSSSFIDLNKENKKCLNLNLNINNLRIMNEVRWCLQNEWFEFNKVSKNNDHVVFLILMIDFRFMFMTFPFTFINTCL